MCIWQFSCIQICLLIVFYQLRLLKYTAMINYRSRIIVVSLLIHMCYFGNPHYYDLYWLNMWHECEKGWHQHLTEWLQLTLALLSRTSDESLLLIPSKGIQQMMDVKSSTHSIRRINEIRSVHWEPLTAYLFYVPHLLNSLIGILSQQPWKKIGLIPWRLLTDSALCKQLYSNAQTSMQMQIPVKSGFTELHKCALEENITHA